jgi:hypothetical protein
MFAIDERSDVYNIKATARKKKNHWDRDLGRIEKHWKRSVGKMQNCILTTIIFKFL